MEIFYITVMTVFKTRSTKEPQYLANHLCNDNRNGRSILSNIKLSLAKKSFVFRGASSWNQLPEEMRKTVKIGVFKKSLRKWTKLNVPQFLDWSARSNVVRPRIPHCFGLSAPSSPSYFYPDVLYKSPVKKFIINLLVAFQ